MWRLKETIGGGEERGATTIIKEKINKEKITKNIFILISFIKSNRSIFGHEIEENLLSQMANSKDKICAILKNKFKGRIDQARVYPVCSMKEITGLIIQ